MSDIWTIKGQAGKAIDDSARTLAQLHCEGLAVAFGSLRDDELTWNVWLKSMAEVAELVPDIGQKISLHLNGSRYFFGHVTGREPAFDAGAWGYAITVSGPWYWLRAESISSEVEDETTVVQERAVYLFDVGDPSNHLISLATRAIARGMPLALGTFATCSDVPRLSLRDMSYADAITDVMRLVVDGLVYFDYSGADGTFPRLCMQRRDMASEIGVDIALVATQRLRLRPRHDLKISEITLNYATRETYGNKRATAYKKLTAGATGGDLPDRQIITVAGPEISLMLPQDLTDFVVVKSAPIDGHVGDALEIWHDLLKAGQASVAGVEVYEVPIVESVFLGDGNSNGDTIIYTWPYEAVLVITDAEGNTLSLADWPYYLTKGEIKDWWKKDGIKSVMARVTATVASFVIVDLNSTAVVPDPRWAKILGATKKTQYTKVGNVLKYRHLWQAHVSTMVPLVKTLWETNTTLIRQEDWGWFNPPAGFAAYLLATQNWVPWEGEVPLATDETPPPNAVGSVLNVASWVPEAATMRGMISGYSVTPATGQIAYTLGPPARYAFRDLVNRFRQSGADNIYWLGGSADPAGPPDFSILDEDSTSWEINEDNTTYPTTENS